MTATPRATACLSELALLQLDAHELDAARARSAQAHLDACRRCLVRFAEIGAERQRFAAAASPIWMRPRRRARWPRYVAAASGVAVAALVLLLVIARDQPAGGGERRKGRGLALGFYVHRAGRVVAGRPGQAVFPTDQLRFTVRGDAGVAHVTVLSLDGSGHASVYAPVGAAPLRVELTAHPQLLPGAVELDAVLGRERLFAVACGPSFELEPLRAALERSGTLRAPPGCRVDQVTLDKRAGAPR